MGIFWIIGIFGLGKEADAPDSRQPLIRHSPIRSVLYTFFLNYTAFTFYLQIPNIAQTSIANRYIPSKKLTARNSRASGQRHSAYHSHTSHAGYRRCSRQPYPLRDILCKCCAKIPATHPPGPALLIFHTKPSEKSPPLRALTFPQRTDTMH